MEEGQAAVADGGPSVHGSPGGLEHEVFLHADANPQREDCDDLKHVQHERGEVQRRLELLAPGQVGDLKAVVDLHEGHGLPRRPLRQRTQHVPALLADAHRRLTDFLHHQDGR